MKIIQLLPTISFGDAVGNDTLALNNLIKDIGCDTAIYAENIDSRIKCAEVFHYRELPELNKDDIILYHFSTGSDVMESLLMDSKCRKIMIYHNITPADFFLPYDANLAQLVKSGRESLNRLVNIFELCIADSSFNKQDLIDAGYKCPIEVIPILIPFQDYEAEPNKDIIKEYGKDDYTNILFVGRVAPNKCQEDIIKSFAYYQRELNTKCRLFIVGNFEGMEIYQNRLLRYAEAMAIDIKKIIFTGHTSFDRILAYYSIADVFVCMSRHEGFCVPLVEAMYFNVPIIALSAAAVPETLGGSGAIVNSADSILVARLIAKLKDDKNFRENILKKQRLRLHDFSYDVIAEKAKKILKEILQNEGGTLKFTDVNSAISIDNHLVEAIIDGMKKDIMNEELYDTSQSFSKIPIISENSAKHIRFKTLIKTIILKPIYCIISAISPSFAGFCRNKIYYLLHKLKYGRFVEYKLSIEGQLERNDSNILVDVTEISKSDAKTGIQRVVNNIFKNLRNLSDRTIAVRSWNGKLITSNKYIDRCNNVAFDNKEQKIQFLKGDKLFLLDSSWTYYGDFSRIIKLANKKNIDVYAVVYDFFPIQYPNLFDSKIFIDVFVAWHTMLLKEANAILCISKTTADILIDYMKNNKIQRKEPLKLYYFHMGADLPDIGSNDAREEIKKFVTTRKTFLMVGTIEPRKGHICVLKTFQKLYSMYEDVNLLIIGKNGWKNEEFNETLNRMEDNIMWISDATDTELHWAYQNVEALISASQDEGYGLPLIEAAFFGLPIICSDIKIFHEVAGNNATYFKCMDSDDLTKTIRLWMQKNEHPDSKNIKIFTWEESAKEILDIMDGKVKPYQII